VAELPEEITLLVRREREAARLKQAHEQAHDALRKEIEGKLLTAGIGKARANGLSVSLAPRERQSIDKEATPKSVLDGLAYKTTRYMHLDIRERREKP